MTPESGSNSTRNKRIKNKITELQKASSQHRNPSTVKRVHSMRENSLTTYYMAMDYYAEYMKISEKLSIKRTK